MNPPSTSRVCGYPHCGSSLESKSPRAVYCSRAHKELAKEIRDRQKAGTFPRTGTCSKCGATFPASNGGPTSPFCPAHRTRRPCAGCGRTLRYRAVSRFCRNCQSARRRPRPDTRIWTRLCDACGAIFEGSPSTNLCDTHNHTKEDQS